MPLGTTINIKTALHKELACSAAVGSSPGRAFRYLYGLFWPSAPDAMHGKRETPPRKARPQPEPLVVGAFKRPQDRAVQGHGPVCQPSPKPSLGDSPTKPRRTLADPLRSREIFVTPFPNLWVATPRIPPPPGPGLSVSLSNKPFES